MNANIETAIMSLIGNDPHRRQISFRDSAQLLFRRLSFRHLQVQLPLLLSNKLVVS